MKYLNVLCTLLPAIKNVLKNEDLNPETQEKLLQLQKYQEQQLQNPISQTSTKKQPLDAENSSSESEPPKKLSDNFGYF